VREWRQIGSTEQWQSNLPAMGMARELQINRISAHRIRIVWLVDKQNGGFVTWNRM
jgi:hypothetical protein